MNIKPSKASPLKKYLALIPYVVLASLATILVSVAANPNADAAPVTGFNAGKIIDDGIFVNSGSMNPTQIQSFLNSKVPVCDTNGVQPHNYQQTTFVCLKDYTEGGKSSAQIIYDAAQEFQINPQVLIVLLQKEQALITDTWPLDGQYRTATGYGCPDTAACDSQYYGLTNQIRWAARMFRSILNNNPDWYTPYVLGDNYVRWNPESSCGGSTINIQNRSTQALYNYTPYQPNQSALNAGYGLGDSCSAYGNRNFYLYFRDWFGPTLGTKILKKDGDPMFYVYSGGKKTPIPNNDLFVAYGFDKIGVTITSAAYLDSLPTTSPLTRLSRYNNGNVQLIDQGYRYTVPSLAICANWGLECSNPYIVNTLDDDLFTTKWLGMLQPLMYTSGNIYKMESGKKLPFLNMQAITENGYSLTQTSTVSAPNARQPVGQILPSEGVSFRLSNGSIMVYTKGQYIAVGDVDIFYRWGLEKYYYPTLPPSLWDNQPPVATTSLSDFYISYSDTKLLIEGGQKIDLSTSFSNWPATATVNPYIGNLLNRLSLIPTTPQTCFKTSGGDIFVTENSKRRSIRLVDDVYRLGCRPDTLVAVNETSLQMLSQGPAKLTQNRLFKKAGAAGIYMTTSPTSSVSLPSFGYVTAFGQLDADVAVVDDATLTSYPVQGTVSSIAGNEAYGVYFLYSQKGIRYYFGDDVFKAWGFNKQTIPTYDNKIGDRNTLRPATVFARTQNGTIYYASGAGKHRVTTYETFVRLGGSPYNTMDVLDDFVTSTPTGTDIN